MYLSKEKYARKRICNGCSVWIENTVTLDNRQTVNLITNANMQYMYITA